MCTGLEPDKRFLQADKEALITLGLFAFYFLWWCGWAYGLGNGDPEEYSYILGFPAWFFMSCIVGYPVITLVLWAALRRWFKELPLDDDAPTLHPSRNSEPKQPPDDAGGTL